VGGQVGLRFIAYDDAAGWATAAPELIVGGDPTQTPTQGFVDATGGYAGGAAAVAYQEAWTGALRVYRLLSESWEAVTPEGVTLSEAAESVGVASFSDVVYLFFRDGSTNRGTVYRLADGAWAVMPFDETRDGVTGQYNVRHFGLDAHNNRVFAAYIEGSGGGTPRVAVYE
jgi:hypothetical protein